MTRVAILFELALVGIGVAIDATLELEAHIDRHPAVTWFVTLGAGCRLVLAGQREMRLGVIERLLVQLGALPSRGVVALQAVGAESPVVLILMAGGAGWTEPHVSTSEILLAQKRMRGWSNVLEHVAIAASKCGVFSVQNVAGLGVVEPFHRRVPVHHIEVFAVVV